MLGVLCRRSLRGSRGGAPVRRFAKAVRSEQTLKCSVSVQLGSLKIPNFCFI